MKKWNNIVTRYHNWAHKDDEYDLLVGDPTARSVISDLEISCGFSMPQEFIDFYLTYNGMGVKTASGELSWVIVPLEMLADCRAEARDWFQDTHPELASRFYPFISWDSGDYSGFLTSADGALLPGLYDFWHEEYEFEEGQPDGEFLQRGDASIEKFLSSR